jgi:phospholipase C
MAKNIQHLVVLMLENRSFDHALGFLKGNSYPIDGLDGNESNPDSAGVSVTVSADARYAGDLGKDPAHDFIGVNEQIFGNSQGTGSGPFMKGFVKNYQSKTGNVAKSHNIMKCFKPDRLPALKTLAQEYALCDRWFASVPGPTLPNRAFVYGATSLGRVDMTPKYQDLKTVFELLTENQVTSRIYYFDWNLGLVVKKIVKNSSVYFRSFDDFVSDCKKNKLPSYSFIEPRYNDFSSHGEFRPANDEHPDHDVLEGDHLIRDVYEAVTSNQQTWESTILVITYDEHGGLFDHVKPPDTVNPDGLNTVTPPFDFKRLGIRVPAVIVSPYVPRGTIIHDKVFDHTSVIATARKLFINDWQNHFLTQRDKQANTFDDCLSLTNPRTDKPPIPTAAVKVAALGKAAAKPPKAAGAQTGAGLSELQEAMVLHALTLETEELPPKKQTGFEVSAIKSDQQVAEYLAAVQAKVVGKVGGKKKAKTQPGKQAKAKPKARK